MSIPFLQHSPQSLKFRKLNDAEYWRYDSKGWIMNVLRLHLNGFTHGKALTTYETVG